MEDGMGLLDSIRGSLGQVAAAEAPALISAALAKTNLGDFHGLVTKLQQGGLNEQVTSWLGNGTNLQLTADQLRTALGNDQIKEMAEHFGVPGDAALQLLAKNLPTAVDQVSQDGALKSS
jgi:uncharacterized protein YidB (DUF937 family)